MSNYNPQNREEEIRGLKIQANKAFNNGSIMLASAVFMALNTVTYPTYDGNSDSAVFLALVSAFSTWAAARFFLKGYCSRQNAQMLHAEGLISAPQKHDPQHGEPPPERTP
ncbi:MAG: hypothetical protein ACPGRX_07520 [Bdellovibrionales bacterium]